MIKIKVCGITRLEDALLASNIGAWAVGFVFYEKSPRFIEPEKAFEIISKLPKTVQKIGVFVNPTQVEIIRTVKATDITMIQLHGNESPEFCRDIRKITNLPVIKAFSIKDDFDPLQLEKYEDIIQYALLDTYTHGFGGSGKTFNWEVAAKLKEFKIPVILAGGLNAENITKAKNMVDPFAFDVSSGVEKDKGIKDPEKIRTLFKVAEILA